MVLVEEVLINRYEADRMRSSMLLHISQTSESEMMVHWQTCGDVHCGKNDKPLGLSTIAICSKQCLHSERLTVH